MNASYQASLVNRHIRRFTGCMYLQRSGCFSACAVRYMALDDMEVYLKHNDISFRHRVPTTEVCPPPPPGMPPSLCRAERVRHLRHTLALVQPDCRCRLIHLAASE